MQIVCAAETAERERCPTPTESPLFRAVPLGAKAFSRPSLDDGIKRSLVAPASTPFSASDQWREWLGDRLTLGARYTSFTLKDTRHETYDAERSSYFLGSINELREDRDSFSVRPFLQAWPLAWLGAELTWDRVAARTITAEDGHSDGVFVASGPMLGLAARWPNATRATPYAGVGHCFFDVSFEAEPWWALAYSDEAIWVEMGCPDVPRGSRRRVIETNGGSGFFWYVGCALRLYQQWSLDVYYRRVSVETDATFSVRQRGTLITEPLHGVIPLGHSAWGVGVSYSF